MTETVECSYCHLKLVPNTTGRIIGQFKKLHSDCTRTFEDIKKAYIGANHRRKRGLNVNLDFSYWTIELEENSKQAKVRKLDNLDLGRTAGSRNHDPYWDVTPDHLLDHSYDRNYQKGNPQDAFIATAIENRLKKEAEIAERVQYLECVPEILLFH